MSGYASDDNVSALAARFGSDQGVQDDRIGATETAATAAGDAAAAADAKAADAQKAKLPPYMPFASRADAQAATVPSSVEYLRVLSGNQDLGYVQGSTDGSLWTGDSKVWLPADRVLPHHFSSDIGTSGGADEADAFQEALDYCSRAHRALFIPEAPVRSNGTRGFYSLSQTLFLNDGQTINGDGKWRSELRWIADVNGIRLADAASGSP